MVEDPCTECKGSGQTARHETLKIKIPKGIDDGMTLRVTGHGLPGPDGAPPGDLHVTVFTTPDPRFQRRGPDLWRSETIDVTEAALGAQRMVPTLDGDVTITVPPGTQPDTVLRLRGKGLPRIDGGDRGDMNVRVQVHVPERISDAVKAAFEQLRSALESETHGR